MHPKMAPSLSVPCLRDGDHCPKVGSCPWSRKKLLTAAAWTQRGCDWGLSWLLVRTVAATGSHTPRDTNC